MWFSIITKKILKKLKKLLTFLYSYDNIYSES